MTVGKQVLRGSLVSYGSFLTGKILTFVSTLILARLLVPHDFGLIGYALLVLGFLYVLKNLGMGTALVYRQDLTEDEAGQIFVIAVAAALLFTAIAWVLAPATAMFFGDPRITPMIRVLGFTFVLNALGDVHNAQLQKRMQFGRRFVPSLLFSITKGSLSIGLAIGGLGYWSLVWGQLAGDAVSTLACWALFPWLPRIRLHWAFLGWVLRYGGHVAILEIVGLVLVNTDNVIVGRTLGGAALGMYALAYTIPQMLTINLSGAVSQAVFPAFATIQGDMRALRRGYLKVLRYTALVLLPIGLGFGAVAPAFVHAFYKPVWWPMIPATQALALYATIFAVGWSASDIYMAIGRPDLQWKLDGIQAMILIPILLLGAHLDGITGVALAQVIAVVPYGVARYWLIHRTLGVGYGAIAAAIRLPIQAGAMLCVACLAVAHIAEPRGMAPIVILAVQMALGAAIYVLVVLASDQDLRVATRLRRPVARAAASVAAGQARADQPRQA
jgi:O-antigen/teichoic acid export membrane protein